MITKIIAAKGGEFAVEAGGRLRAVETYYGLKDDVKPTEGVNNADRYVEIDGSGVWLFDADNAKWHKLGV